MTIPKGWFVLYKPKYKSPSIFDLHERGLFTSMPYVSQRSGAYILINEDLHVAIYYKCITEGHQVKNNIAYSYLSQKGLIRLSEDMQLNQKELPNISLNTQEEIKQVYEDWRKSYIPLQEDGKINMSETKTKLRSSLDDGKKAFREELKQKNSNWIEPALSVMTWRFKHIIYGLVFDDLYPDYMARGGEDTEDGLIKKIQTFCRIYESNDFDNLAKPDSSRWQSYDDIWNCWIAYSGSESEAERVCQCMEAVFRPAYARFI
ncbi:MAG: hypothetical protein HQK72_08445 [Desulfamplus sp.]|nr:hypothetical protein [Desulfamplus sp.]